MMSSMARDEHDESPGTSLARRQQAASTRDGSLQQRRGDLIEADAPSPAVRNSMSGMLQASVESYGDVVSALLIDLEHVSAGMRRMGWLSTTMDLLASEQAYRAAQQQLAWWDSFLRDLPIPELLSDHQVQARRRARAERLGATILAREQALADHQALVAQKMAEPGHSEQDRSRLRRIKEDPDETEWWVDPEAYVAQALAQLPPEPPHIPIVAEDLDANRSFSGYNAARAMREHPLLGPRAAQLDGALARLLSEEFGLKKKDAQGHAAVLTDMFWIALRRALEQGGDQLATAVHFVVPTRDHEIQEQFSRELLESWLHHLENLPPPRQRRSIAQRMGLLGRREERAALAATDTPRQLTTTEPPSTWSRIKKAFSSD